MREQNIRPVRMYWVTLQQEEESLNNYACRAAEPAVLEGDKWGSDKITSFILADDSWIELIYRYTLSQLKTAKKTTPICDEFAYT